MCASDEFVGGVSNEERRSIEADPVLRRWRANHNGYEHSESGFLGVVFFALICVAVVVAAAVLVLQ